jgi:tetratricopeptide (TPR) repeat protein
MNDEVSVSSLTTENGHGESRRELNDATSDVGNGLQCLLDQSLVTRRNLRDGTHRFDMLETIRSFADEQLVEHGEETITAERHLEWCLTLVESAEPNWFGSNQRSWLRRLDLERGNITSALSWAMRHGAFDAGIRLALLLTDYWYLSGQLSEGRVWLERALDLTPWEPDKNNSCLTRIRLLASVSQLAQPNGDLPLAAERAEESLRLAQELNDVPGIARAATLLGNIATVRNDLTTAESYHQQALDHFRRLDDSPWVVVGLNNLAIVALRRADHGRALTLSTEAVHLARAICDEWGAGIALRFLGDVALSRGGHKLAAHCFSESLSIGEANSSHWAIADGLAAFGSLAVGQGMSEHGVRFFAAASAIYDLIGLHLPPKLRPDWTVALREANAQLGTVQFNAAWQSGTNARVELVIGEALDHGRLTRSGALS